MRKRNKGGLLSRPKNQRIAMLNLLMGSLFLHEKIQTTESYAKALRVVAEKFITRARNNNISNKRLILRSLSRSTTKKLIDEIAPKYINRKGGYTRIMKLGRRKSDGAKMAIIELVK
jgi:large subunit ribosomal protein L17